MRGHRVVGAMIVTATLLGGLGGCVKYYWSKAGAPPEDFTRDNTQCLNESHPTTATIKAGVFVEQLYRSCLETKGWVRTKEFDPPPPGYYRGQE